MTKRIHILGICGTFMGGLAQLAVQAGFEVTGSDENVYPPMSDRLRDLGITLYEGYDVKHLQPAPDCVIIGNVMTRGNSCVEYVLNERISYASGPRWLYENILAKRQVIAVAGTHGKTTTTTLLVWLLKQAGIDCGYLIGGVPQGLEHSAHLGNDKPFVIEADEYDSAFFDKRSKFLHYHPNILLFNNLEFDHADIFANLDAIKWQFHILLRTIPQNGLVIHPEEDDDVLSVIESGCWTPTVSWGQQQGDVRWQLLTDDGTAFAVTEGDHRIDIEWPMLGEHNVKNATAALIAARHLGVSDAQLKSAFKQFPGIKRRLEQIACVHDIKIYDDFAHHPTAVAYTLAAMRAKAKKDERVIAVIEFASHTMRSGHHQDRLQGLFDDADATFMLAPQESGWDAQSWTKTYQGKACVSADIDQLIAGIVDTARAGDHVVIMSNRSFAGIYQTLQEQLASI
ncbi:MAG: UDP-N-acetylmuramate:L-alanyl-gamma-D-glutamyl-meso-diaminopimelate ligase [Coxiellaceae bacterium]|nr:UDP-N-acetylmuramate:L-alanyl-gamma-D-glutamyl-meso-diaminopimelate ligase [Coxiellaceae bacterium]